MTTTQGG